MALMGVDVVGALVALAVALSGHASASHERAAVENQPEQVRLQLTRTEAQPGERIALIVVNDGDKQVRYGVATRFQRYHRGRWINAMRAVYGRKRPLVRLILLYAPPHGRGGPTGLDAVVLPTDLRPGRYRAVKRVRIGPRRGVKLRAGFRVRR